MQAPALTDVYSQAVEDTLDFKDNATLMLFGIFLERDGRRAALEAAGLTIAD